ncbi:hypothetical protein HHL11_07030 [Ramlibacter sp. G-1-2-2]|uniref:Uncharacterized protein n=1 Tax=Ramlibacter agri TaxID=2728837 RepID=A0A848GY40_9BURK|nr:hypothetical protein [Ramlibacter agri]NML43495.1 hypothetical protein [Ramlibacter agri]
MTTNVYDGNVGLMTTDSRWSAAYGNYLIYVDDARFEKIERYNDAVFMFAGDGHAVQKWKSWIRSNPADDSNMPSCDKMCVCIARVSDKQVLFKERQDIVQDGAFFAGSGSRYAYVCWNDNRCAKRAVETAKQFDFSSGGDVKFFEFDSGKHNLFSPAVEVTVDDVLKALNDRGMVMEIAVNGTSKPPFKLKEAAANDPELKEVQAKIANGEISPTAPCDGMYSEWTPAQTSKLKSVLGEVFGWKK